MRSANLSWSSYYETMGEPSWLDALVSAIHNLPYLAYVIKGRPESILEIGTGRGLHAILLSYLVPRVVGIDIDENLIKRANRLNSKFKGKANFYRMDGFRLTFKDHSFSICCSQGFMEHFPDLDILALIQEQLRVARLVIFSVPSCYYPTRNLGDERLMSLREWKEIMNGYESTGFYYGPIVDTSKGLRRNLGFSSLKKMLAPLRGQICIKIRGK